MKIVTRQLNAGFSILELMVVLVVFAMVVLAAGSLFISVVDRQRNMMIDQEMTSQASLAVEYLSRSLRNVIEDPLGECTGTVGGVYALTHYDGASNAYRGVVFLTPSNGCQEFYIDDYGFLVEEKNNGVPQNIFSNTFKINYLRFAINGAKSIVVAKKTDSLWPRITLVLSIKKPQDQIAQRAPSFFAWNIAKAQIPGNPVCGNGICEEGESLYCSSLCPLADDCGTCVAPPQPPTGLSCSNGTCIASPGGSDLCILGSICGSPPQPPTGLACVNETCVSQINGIDTCVLGSFCSTSPTPPGVTGLSCVNNSCVVDPLGIDTCSLGNSCASLPDEPTGDLSPSEFIIQTTISPVQFN